MIVNLADIVTDFAELREAVSNLAVEDIKFFQTLFEPRFQLDLVVIAKGLTYCWLGLVVSAFPLKQLKIL